MLYRKKPVVVNAVQFFDNTPTPGVYGGFVNQRHCIACLPEKNYKVSGPAVITIHGQITPVAEGDWIIDEGDGLHFYPCKPDIFEATYEPVVLPPPMTAAEADTAYEAADPIPLSDAEVDRLIKIATDAH